ncbi:transporter substrate-binding domain-containing protein [Bifidobacterium sp. ESL0790]|uniref:transporter substrate-binding domain-containing protein n=1 Tax=Bifidobacterium sp. ESL0790 TaxID=2983233 RepID=UPI0023F6E6ED|nr:transporter substrate-binding domain-containing protein [Bifidobacterium sp. ESL0790]WEV71771.1 transporter substrate-binding domain-containing protein [Bifidobacterium sp. ESL0790]
MLTTAGCGAEAPESANVPQGPTIAIAVPSDEPGLGLLHEGRYSGFDIDVARYVAKKLGYANKQIVFKPVAPGQRASILKDGKADMLVAALPAGMGVSGQSGDDGIGVSKPYLGVSRGLMVSLRLKRFFHDRDSFAGRQVCTASAGVDTSRFVQYLPGAVLQTRDTYQQCLTALIAGEADAVSADDALLNGLVQSDGHGRITVLDSSAFTLPADGGSAANPSPDGSASMFPQVAVVEHAVAIRQSKGELTAKIDTILGDMAKDGSWRKAADTMFRTIGYRPDPSLNPTDAS